MFSRVIAGSTLLLPMLLAGQPAAAQRVQADIRIGSGPIAGHIRIGPDPYYGYRYRDLRPRVVRVEVLRGRDYYRRPGWFRQFRRESRAYVIYYDRYRDFYYDRFRPGLLEVHVYQRGGRFYRWDSPRFERWVRDRWHDDRWDDRFDDRFDRYDNRYEGRYDRDRDDRDRYDRDRRDRDGRYGPRGRDDRRGRDG
jgi:hypothetical protein